MHYSKEPGPFVFLAVSNGIGAGILIQDRLLRGFHHSAGEAGRTLESLMEVDCCIYKGSRSMMESIAAMAFFKGQAESLLHGGQSTILSSLTGQGNGADKTERLFEAAEKGCPLCRQGIDDFIKAIAYVLSNTAAVLDPADIVMGGDISAIKDVGSRVIEKIVWPLKKTMSRNR